MKMQRNTILKSRSPRAMSLCSQDLLLLIDLFVKNALKKMVWDSKIGQTDLLDFLL
jgi:hypothetical protein